MVEDDDFERERTTNINKRSKQLDTENDLTQELGALIAASECLLTDARTLLPLEWPPLTREGMAAPDVIVPEYPLVPSVVVRRMLPEEERHPVRKRMFEKNASGMLVGGLAAAWRWTP